MRIEHDGTDYSLISDQGCLFILKEFVHVVSKAREQ